MGARKAHSAGDIVCGSWLRSSGPRRSRYLARIHDKPRPLPGRPCSKGTLPTGRLPKKGESLAGALRPKPRPSRAALDYPRPARAGISPGQVRLACAQWHLPATSPSPCPAAAPHRDQQACLDVARFRRRPHSCGPADSALQRIAAPVPGYLPGGRSPLRNRPRHPPEHSRRPVRAQSQPGRPKPPPPPGDSALPTGREALRGPTNPPADAGAPSRAQSARNGRVP